MMLKCRRRANTAVPTNSDMSTVSGMPANVPMPGSSTMAMFLTSCERNAHTEMWLRVNAYVRVSTLPNMHTKSDVIRQYTSSELPRFLFYGSRYLPSLNYSPGKKQQHIDIALAIVFEDKMKS